VIKFLQAPNWVRDNREELQGWLTDVVEARKCLVKEASFVFYNNQEIQEANLEFLGHDYPTDVITFDYSEANILIVEVLLGWERIQEQAGELRISKEEELSRVMVHALLHCIGFNDRTQSEKSIMRREEDKCLLLRPKKLIVS